MPKLKSRHALYNWETCLLGVSLKIKRLSLLAVSCKHFFSTKSSRSRWSRTNLFSISLLTDLIIKPPLNIFWHIIRNVFVSGCFKSSSKISRNLNKPHRTLWLSQEIPMLFNPTIISFTRIVVMLHCINLHA